MTEDELLERITIDPEIFGGKPIIRGMWMAVEHVLGSGPITPIDRKSARQWLQSNAAPPG